MVIPCCGPHSKSAPYARVTCFFASVSTARKLQDGRGLVRSHPLEAEKLGCAELEMQGDRAARACFDAGITLPRDGMGGIISQHPCELCAAARDYSIRSL